MIKAIRRHGNSHAVLLDKPILDLLGVRAGSQLQVTISEGSLVLTPIEGRPRDPGEIDARLDEIASEYGPVFEGLDR